MVKEYFSTASPSPTDDKSKQDFLKIKEYITNPETINYFKNILISLDQKKEAVRIPESEEGFELMMSYCSFTNRKKFVCVDDKWTDEEEKQIEDLYSSSLKSIMEKIEVKAKEIEEEEYKEKERKQKENIDRILDEWENLRVKCLDSKNLQDINENNCVGGAESRDWKKVKEKIKKLEDDCLNTKTYDMFLSKRCYWTKKEDILSNGEKLRDNCLKTNTLDNAKKIFCDKITDIKKNIRIIPTDLNNFEFKEEDISNHISNLEKENEKRRKIKLFIIIGVILAVIIFLFFFFFMQSKGNSQNDFEF